MQEPAFTYNIFLPSFSDLFLSHASTSLSSVQLILLPCPSPTSSLFPSRFTSLPHPSKCLSIPGYRCPHLFLSPGPYLCLSVHRCPLWPATAVPPCAATKCWCAVRKGGGRGGLMNIHVIWTHSTKQSLALPRKPLPSMRWWKRGTVRLGQTLWPDSTKWGSTLRVVKDSRQKSQREGKTIPEKRSQKISPLSHCLRYMEKNKFH